MLSIVVVKVGSLLRLVGEEWAPAPHCQLFVDILDAASILSRAVASTEITTALFKNFV